MKDLFTEEQPATRKAAIALAKQHLPKASIGIIENVFYFLRKQASQNAPIKSVDPLIQIKPYQFRDDIGECVKRTWNKEDYHHWYQSAFDSLGILTQHTRDIACRRMANLSYTADQQYKQAEKTYKNDPKMADALLKTHMITIRMIMTLEQAYGLRPERNQGEPCGTLLNIVKRKPQSKAKLNEFDEVLGNGELS